MKGIETLIILGGGAALLYWISQTQSNGAAVDTSGQVIQMPDGSFIPAELAPAPQDISLPAAPMSSSIMFQTTVPFAQYGASGMKTSTAGLANIQRFEGRSNVAYPDPPGSGKFSIGVGHHITGADGLTPNSYLNDAQIDALFATDVSGAENAVASYVKVPLTQGQFDALVDFVFNLGAPEFAGSTMLQLLNSNDYSGASSEFAKWVMSGGKPNANLIARRAVDTQTFLT
jgi:lysozyme